jgi:proline racemase
VDLRTVDAHVAGTVVRLVVAGVPPVDAGSLAERSASLVARTGGALIALAREPRGHAGTILAVLAEPERADADAGVVFLDGDGVLAFSGEGVIGATAIALDRGLVGPRQPDHVDLDTMGGAVRVRRRSDRSGIVTVSYTSTPASVLRANHSISRGPRRIHADLVWSGAELIAIIDAEAAGAPLVAGRVFELQRAGREVLRALEDIQIVAPESGTHVEVTSVVFIGAPPEQGADLLSGTVLREGSVLRSPGGTSTAAVATVLCAMGVLALGQRFVHQGITGTTLGAEISAIEDRDGQAYVTVDVEGEAWPIGEHTFTTSAGDPLAAGVRLA